MFFRIVKALEEMILKGFAFLRRLVSESLPIVSYEVCMLEIAFIAISFCVILCAIQAQQY